jgi:NAD(P)-dependent dehydrogenase (short-subunit alcohol dehydrogenase family)
MTGLLAGKRAVITGGTRGLGAAMSRAFAAEGARVAVLDRTLDHALTGNFHAEAVDTCDVSDEAELKTALQGVTSALGSQELDIVVANAGLVPPWRETEALDLDEWDRVMAVNVRGVAATLKHAVPLMKAKGGSIILMASINAAVSHPRQMLYTASKHAVLGILRAAALDLGRHGIRVNALGPGPIATEALLERLEARASAGGAAPDDALAGFAAQAPLGRIASADEVAKAAVFLASDLSSGITGRMIPVDCGLIA